MMTCYVKSCIVLEVKQKNTALCDFFPKIGSILGSLYVVFVNTYCVCSWFQIAMYVFFPVGVFYYFNLPDFYDNIVLKKKVKTSAVGHKAMFGWNLLLGA